MPMYWTFNCFLGCIYTVYCIVYIVVLVLNWLSNLEFRLPKKEDQVARIQVMGGEGFRWFGQCPKENVFLPLTPSLSASWLFGGLIASGWERGAWLCDDWKEQGQTQWVPMSSSCRLLVAGLIGSAWVVAIQGSIGAIKVPCLPVLPEVIFVATVATARSAKFLLAA